MSWSVMKEFLVFFEEGVNFPFCIYFYAVNLSSEEKWQLVGHGIMKVHL